MGSSKKHKKHKDRDRESKRSHHEPETSTESKPSLRLVLKVGGGSTSSSSPSRVTTTLPVMQSSQQMPIVESLNVLHPVVHDERLNAVPEEAMEVASSSGKKIKKKKSKKKHRKHHHHSCDHSHHHHRHHHKHHKSTCHRSHKKEKDTEVISSLDSQSEAVVKNDQEVMQVDSKDGNDVGKDVAPVVSLVKESVLKASLKTESRSFYINFLNLILKSIEKRDPQNFFAWPVTDVIAPGYSSIISHPMDLSTIKKKIESYVYDTVYDMRADVKLMCDNAMTYNLPETIYFKAAKKLWYHSKEKVFSREELNQFRSQAASMPEAVNPPPSVAILENANLYSSFSSKKKRVTEASGQQQQQQAPQADIFGFIPSVSPVKAVEKPPVVTVTPPKIPSETTSTPASIYPPLEKILAIPFGPKKQPEPETVEESEEEEDDSEEAESNRILMQAQKAASAAAGKLSLAKPSGVHYSFLRQKKDGSTSLSIIGSQPCQERYLKIDDLVGKLPDGTPFLPSYSEADSLKVRPIDSLDVGPFASYLPNLDCSRSKLTKEETSLLLSTYGEEETGIPYTKSLVSFAGESEYLLRMADSLLDILTQGQHSKEVKEFLRQQEKEEEKDISDKEAEGDVSGDPSEETKQGKEVDSRLSETQDILSALHQVQEKRLSATSRPTTASSEEVHLAHLLSSKLTDFMSSYSIPSDVTDIKSIRKILGVTLKSDN